MLLKPTGPPETWSADRPGEPHFKGDRALLPFRVPRLIAPLVLAVAQLDDPVFLGVAARSVAWSFACFVALYLFTIWVVHGLLDIHGTLAWFIDILGSIGASMLALWMFLPVAAAIGTFYIDRVALAVEQRFYPSFPAARGAPVGEQIWDGLAVGLRVLMLNTVALMLALLMPGIGLPLAWMIAAFAIGRGLFVAVAMRRMPRARAESLYRSRRAVILAQGAMLAFAVYIPILNLLIPVIGTAAMVHILDRAFISKGNCGSDSEWRHQIQADEKYYTRR